MLPRVKGVITLKQISATLSAGQSGRLTFALNTRAHAELRSYIRQHHHAHLEVTVHLVLRDGNGTRSLQTFAYTISRARDLGQL